MAITVISNHLNRVSELIADTVNDKQKLLNGTAQFDVGAGSTCIIVEDSSVLMCKSDNTWKELE